MCRTDEKLKLLQQLLRHKLAPPDTEAEFLMPFLPIYVKSVLVSFVIFFYLHIYSQHIAVVNSETCYIDI